jgi:2-keto-3-deoxy-galactonokinase
MDRRGNNLGMVDLKVRAWRTVVAVKAKGSGRATSRDAVASGLVGPRVGDPAWSVAKAGWVVMR